MPSAKNKIIVFADPHCPYCKKLHEVLKQAVARSRRQDRCS
ncbi:MAG: thioredoxin fold domain-containing protein [Desulfuromonadales bacterium]|nr:thioredoxin fold domain-containing protein [Desulfuromonadales bacterium]